MSARPAAVGIDVVDLLDPRCRGKAADGRFTGRILGAAEAAAVAGHDDPDLALWRTWARKEAAYKVVSKSEGAPPPFVHAAFEVGGAAVRWKGRTVPVRLEDRPGAVVALAWEPVDGDGAPPVLDWEVVTLDEADPDPELGLEALVERHLHAEERPPVHSRPSALVRLGGRRALARVLGVDPSRVAVVCPGGPTGRTPPLARLDGEPAPADVSLSHHGRFLAWAVRAAGPGGVAPSQKPAGR